MFMGLFIYRIRILLMNRSLLFWTFAFPIILGLMFTLVFGNMNGNSKIKSSQVGIVSINQKQSNNFKKRLASFKQNNRKVFLGKEMTKEEAETRLSSEEISGYVLIDKSKIDLFVNENGMQQNLLKEVLNQYLQSIKRSKYLAASGAIDSQSTKEKEYENLVQDDSGSGNFNLKSFYFFTLVGMTVMNGFIWGIRNAHDQQANQSANGIRICMFPENKLIISFANLLASFTLFNIQLLIILLFYRFVYKVGFSEHWNYILIVSGIGSLAAISLGTFFGNIFSKLNYQQKDSIGNSLILILSFLAGMMGSQSIKYWITIHYPLLGRINVVNLVSECFYQLYYYQDLTPFYSNLAWLFGFCVVCILLNHAFEKRTQYDHI